MTELSPLYDKKCKCQLCGNVFTSKKIRTRFIKLTGNDTDFCPFYSSSENNPLLYTIYVCPICGFSFSDDFTPNFPPHTKELIKEKVSGNWSPQSYSGERSIEDAIKAYKLAVYCSILKKEKHIVLAGIYLRIAWLNRLLQNEEQDQRFMKLAIDEYSKSYISQDYQGTQVSEIRILYIIGELNRKTGNMIEAGKSFSKVFEQQKRAVEPRIVEMAKERWHEMRHVKV